MIIQTARSTYYLLVLYAANKEGHVFALQSTYIIRILFYEYERIHSGYIHFWSVCLFVSSYVKVC